MRRLPVIARAAHPFAVLRTAFRRSCLVPARVRNSGRPMPRHILCTVSPRVPAGPRMRLSRLARTCNGRSVMRRFFRNNGLTVVLMALFVFTWVGQFFAGHREHNADRKEHSQPEISLGE